MMRRRSVWLVVLMASVSVLACAQAPAVQSEPPPAPAPAPAPTQSSPGALVITDASELDGAVGQTVTLVGTQSRTKIPTVLGVDVDGSYEHSDRRVRVTGVLRKHVVVEPAPSAPITAARGPGTYYSIVDPDTQTLAKPVLDD